MLKRRAKKSGRSNESIAVHLPIADEFCVLKAGDESKYAFLLGEFKVGLKADKVIKTACQIILPQLYHSIRALAGARISKPNRAHGPKSKRIDPALGNNLDWKTAFEEMSCFHTTFDRIFERA